MCAPMSCARLNFVQICCAAQGGQFFLGTLHDCMAHVAPKTVLERPALPKIKLEFFLPTAGKPAGRILIGLVYCF